MAVHKIKAKDPGADQKSDPPAKTIKKQPKTPSKKAAKQPTQKSRPLPLRILLAPLRPIFALGRYFRDSWQELRRVIWPDRKFTWKMTFTVIGFIAFFTVLIFLLDTLFKLLFNNIIK